jgi:hypothetical protein
MVTQVKVAWSGMDTAMATWEDVDALKARFPYAPAWGQAAFQDQGNVSSAVPEDTRTMAEKDLTAKTEGGDVSARPRRIKRGSVRVTGPEWAN